MDSSRTDARPAAGRPDGRRPVASSRVASFGETVFATYTRLAQEHGAVNLGQGFPDFGPPDFVLDALARSARGPQQYAPLPGVPALREAVADDLGGRLRREIDPLREVQITVGATEALFAAMQALLEPGDEVVLFEPFYDAYPADVIMAGGVPRYVPLEPDASGTWRFDPERLRGVLGPRTRAIVLTSPHNPTGKVFGPEELDEIVAAAASVDATIVSDEVYERIDFTPHVPAASRPGAWERTLTISSIGKTFSVTGWKIGWAVGPAPLVAALRAAHQWIPFAVATPLQHAAAEVLRTAAAPGNGYYEELREGYRRRRDLLVGALRATPFRPLVPEGGYFVIADASALGYDDDVALCRDLPVRAGVAAIPPSAFYSAEHKGLARSLVRFAYCKSEEAIREGGARLAKLA